MFMLFLAKNSDFKSDPNKELSIFDDEDEDIKGLLEDCMI